MRARSPGPPPPLSAKQAEANRVYAQVQQLDAALGQADERLNLANYRLNQVQHDIVENGRALVVAKANLKKSHDAIAKRLVTLRRGRAPMSLR